MRARALRKLTCARCVLPGFAILASLATPALATEWTICGSADGQASISALVGTFGLGAATDFKVNVGDRLWSTTEGVGTEIHRGQAFADDSTMLIDVVAEDYTTIVAMLRVFRTLDEEGVPVYGGTLKVPGHGAWVVSCDAGDG